MNATAQTKSLLEATGDEISGMEYDNFGTADFWILNDGFTVTIAAQRAGKNPTQKIEVPVKVFRRLIKALTKKQKYDRKRK